MAREIKFRAWHKGYDSLAHGHVMHPSMVFDNTPGDCLRWLNEGQPLEVMQFTGLKDKNDADVYEGDVLEAARESSDDVARYTVEYIAPSFIRRYIDADEWDGIVRDGLVPHDIESRGLFVIGNIYENPELLETKAEVA